LPFSLPALTIHPSGGQPTLFGLDSVHGANYVWGAALPPAPINQGATFDPEAARAAGALAAKDTRAAGIPWLFAPILGIGVEPRWSRHYETYGECPHLVSAMGAAAVEGIQADTNDGGVPRRAAASAKHFIGYSAPTGGLDRAPSLIPPRMLKQLYLPPFRAALHSESNPTGALTVMENYIELDGVPMASSSEHLTDLLRDELGFDGVLVTDYKEIENLHSWHHVAATESDAVAIAMTDTSIDMSMVPTDGSFGSLLPALVEAGDVDEARVDASVLRILALKEKLGLMAEPVPPLSDPLVATVGSAADWAACKRGAARSLVLLKNDGAVLPLQKGTCGLRGPTLATSTTCC